MLERKQCLGIINTTFVFPTKVAKLGIELIGNIFEMGTDISYKICPRRWSDWLAETKKKLGLDPKMDLLGEFTKKIGNDVVGNLFKALTNCNTEKLFNKVIKDNRDLLTSQKDSIINDMKSGNVASAIRNIKNISSLKNQLMDATIGALDLSSLMDSSGFNADRLMSVTNQMGTEIAQKFIEKLINPDAIMQGILNLKDIQSQIEDTIAEAKDVLAELNV